MSLHQDMAPVPGRDGGHYTCPSCHGSATLPSVRAVFDRETSVEDTGALASELAALETSFATTSVLGKRLAPPEQPVLIEPTRCRVSDYLVVASVLPVGLWFSFTYLPQDGPAAGAGMLSWLALIWVVGAALFALPVNRLRSQTRSRHEWEMTRWEERVCNWAELRYCSSCDTVVNPKTARTASVDRIGSLLGGAVRASSGPRHQRA